MAEKAKEDSLFQLIRSLTKAEKRYFKVNSTHTIGEKNNYMRLFDALDKLEEFDDAKFRQKFKNEPFIKYLAAEKNYLYELILKSLRAYRSDKSRYLKLLGLIQDIDLLNEKGLYEECEKRIKKAQKVALDSNYFHINALLIDWKFSLITKIGEENARERVDALHKEVEENARLLSNFYAYRELKNEMQIISKKDLVVQQTTDQEKLSEILNSHFVINPDLAESFIAKQEYFNLMGRAYMIKKLFDEEYKIRVKHLQLFDDNPEMKEEYTKNYKDALTNFLIISVRVNDFVGYENAIEKLGIGNSPEDFKEMKIINMGGNQMFYLMNNSRWDEVLKLSNVLEDMIVKYHQSIYWTQIITIKYNAGCIQFLLGNYSNAVDKFDYIINEKQETYMGQLLASRILHIIGHYEISPPTVVEYLLGSTIRFSNKLQHNNQFNDIILKGIKKLIRTIDKGETRQIMIQLRDDLLQIFEEYQFGLALEETICWLISKLENRPTIDVVNERLEIERQMAVEKIKQQTK
jgi:hypothetical protein